MNLLLDTNIFIFISRYPKLKLLSTVINPDNRKLYVSVVTIAELRSIALQNNWAKEKWDFIQPIIDECYQVEATQTLVNSYSQIDAYSQRRNPSFQEYSFATPRNMGKNDLWIASTAALLGLTLVTTDKDFDHLHQIFMEVKCISLQTLIAK
jgi:tRNA(fMet)-specific endonuclease VapC